MSLLSRRLVLPLLAIIAAVCCAMGVGAAFELNGQALAWMAVGSAIAGAAASITAALFYARAQAREITAAIERAIPRTATGALLFDAPASATSIERALADLPELFGRKLHEAMRDKGQLLTILSSMSEGLVAVDRQQRLLLANRAAQTLLGVSPADVKGRALWDEIAVEGVARLASEVMLTGQPRTLTAESLNGKYVEVMVSRLPESAGLVIVAHDVTEATRYQRLREEFVANVSHELRTPLTVIKGFIETLRDGAIDDRERAARYLQTLDHHADRLANLVNDLLELSRLEARTEPLKKERVDIARTVQRVAEMMQPAASRKHQMLELKIAGNLPPIPGSDEYLGRAIGNLVENAIKYTRQGGVIRLAAGACDDGISISVEDNGIGIPASDLPRIFERFYRSDPSRSREMGGTGLGLSIVKHIVQAHGGSIDVTSTPGLGSRFAIRLASRAAPIDANSAILIPSS